MCEARPTVILRADAGSSIGFGHFVRTCALAAYLRNDFSCYIATRNPDTEELSDYQLSMILEAGAQPLLVKGCLREVYDSNFIATCIAQTAKDSAKPIIVLDNYYYSTQYQSKVREVSQALICIDDMHNRHFVADAVMTFCPLSRLDFSLEPYTKFYGGIEWSLLRAPFLRPLIADRTQSVSVAKSEQSKAISSIALAMGGADPFRLTDKMIDIIREIDASIQIDVIAGQTVVVESEIDKNVRINRNVNAEKIADIFDYADLGIFPASTVCVEAFARRLPIAAGHYVDNQEEFYRYGVKADWFAPLGCFLDSKQQLKERLEKIICNNALPVAPEFDFRRRRKDIIDLFKQFSK